MRNVIIIYGGRSPEHDVSILTGLHLAKNITDDFNFTLVYITKENKFVYGSKKIDDYISGKASRNKEYKFNKKIDCIINCCHGGIGESGELSAFMKIKNIPITGCDFVAAWKQQSKSETRRILTQAGFLQPRYQKLTKSNMNKINISLPVIVKPDMLGSSIGISIARSKQELIDAIDLAFSMCDEVIVEEFFENIKEVNIAVMRSNGKVITSAMEVVGNENFFSFDEKYLNSSSGFIKKSGKNPDEDFLDEIANQVKEIAVRAYETFGSSGVVRTDFIIQDKKVILNENNTIPGFMGYHLWLKANIPYGIVINDMVEEAIDKHTKDDKIYHFNSDILTKNKQLVLEI